ncbi:MAG: cache domain-containing protein, partial [Bacteroidota bacterium]
MRNTGFFRSILLPSLIAILLFLAAMYIFVIPGYRESLMDRKRETIRELATTAWSVVQRIDHTITDSLDIAHAKKEAIEIIRGMRWGEENKDYFWITDTTPAMIMHPYRPQLDGKPLADYEDQEGKRFFVEIAQIAKESGDGYIDYKWQWKDDSLMVVPKLSYVKLYEPWGWIIGTGIYVEDVQQEITTITRRVVWISFFITLIITAVIVYLARKNFQAEQLRQKAQARQRETMEKYKKLVEASTDGVLMTLNGEVIYCNPYLLNLLGYSREEADRQDEEFLNSLHCLLHLKDNHDTGVGEIVKEHRIRKKNKLMVDVVISRSEFEMGGQNGYIYTIKDVSKHRDTERELDLNMGKFKSIADTMHIGVFRTTIGRSSRFVEVNRKATEMLGYASENEIRDLAVQELFVDRPEKREVIKAISEG